jgi:hypothetical protein
MARPVTLACGCQFPCGSPTCEAEPERERLDLPKRPTGFARALEATTANAPSGRVKGAPRRESYRPTVKGELAWLRKVGESIAEDIAKYSDITPPTEE